MSAAEISRSPAIERLRESIIDARARHSSLDIRGGRTKSFYGEAPRGEALELRELAGISSYEPSELVITARAGTPLAELEAALAERGQCLAFEPPRFAAGGTVGGMVAAGLSGPARRAAGPVRDYVLGVTLLDGRAELLTFGGQVMKNVAGYDVSRLMAGSWGVLGILCEVSLKVVATRPQTATLEFDWDELRSLEELARWRALPLPINASAWHEGCLRVRLAGATAAVESGCRRLGGARIEAGEAAVWWEGVRDHGHAFFRPSGARLASGECLWRISVPPTTPPLGGRSFIEWGGAQRWSYARAEAAREVRTRAQAAGGHATLVRAADKSIGAFAPVAEPLARSPPRPEERLRSGSCVQPRALVRRPVREQMQTKLSTEFEGTALGLEAQSILRKCVHCGFCNATCPTYQLLGDELDGPRGRIYLIKEMLEGHAVTELTQRHLDRCLTCRNCETTCPSGVRYGHLLEIGRHVLEQRVDRPLLAKTGRWLLKESLTSRLFGPALQIGRKLRPLLPATLRAKISPGAQAATQALRLREHRRKVLLLGGCVQPAMRPQIHRATRRVLDAAGIQTLFAAGEGCCGALRTHLADRDGGLADMRRNIDAWWPMASSGAVESIVVNASGCGQMVKEYAHALRDDPAYADKAARISALA